MGILKFVGPLLILCSYAEHNDYITFRRSLHDGKYAPHEGKLPLLPHASTWFDADGPVLSQEKQKEDSTQNNDNEDSDVEAVGENVNMHCPLSLRIMTNPVRSRKCPHNFERSAIEEMLKNSSTRVQGGERHGVHTVKCPVCDVVSWTLPVLKPHFNQIPDANCG